MPLQRAQRTTRRRLRGSHSPTAKPRAGAIVAELILMLPILILLLLAVVEFGYIFVSIKHVAGASRFGAKIASEMPPPSLANLNTDAGGSRLRTDINRYLKTAFIPQGACRVRLEHNVHGIMNNIQLNDASVEEHEYPPPTNDPPLSGEYVRVTVYVPLKKTVPDLLASFGFSLQNKVIAQTTTFPYEHSGNNANADISFTNHEVDKK